MLKGSRASAAQREKISRRTREALARKRARERIAPSEVLELERHGTISRNLRPFAIQAAAESHDLAEALGGVDAISEQRRVLISDVGRLGLVLRVLVAKFLQGDSDPEIGSKIATLIGQRRSSLQALGLDRFERDVPDLRAYLEAKHQAPQDGAGATNGAPAEAEDLPAEIAPQERES